MAHNYETHYGRRSVHRSAYGRGVINPVLRTANRAAVGLFRWATNDHTGFAAALAHMPRMGFLDEVRYVLLHLVIGILSAILTGLWVFVLIAFGIPFLLTGHI